MHRTPLRDPERTGSGSSSNTIMETTTIWPSPARPPLLLPVAPLRGRTHQKSLLLTQRPLSQSTQYLVPRSPALAAAVAPEQQASSPDLAGSSFSIQADASGRDRCQTGPPKVEMTLVYVAASNQLLVYIHRISNLPVLFRHGRQSTSSSSNNTDCYVKVLLDTRRIRRSSQRSALLGESQQPQRCAQVFKFPDVTVRDVRDGVELTTTVYLARGRWRSGKRIAWWRQRLDAQVADGVPRSRTGFLVELADGADDIEVEPCRQMTGAVDLGQLLVSLQHQSAAQPARLKVVIRRAQHLPPTKNMFEPDYIVVVNASYPDGGSETKETIAAKGKVPVWNQTIEFDITHRPIESCWLHLVLLRKSRKGHERSTAIGHLTLGANSTPEGERHWQAIVNNRDAELTQWHRLTSR